MSLDRDQLTEQLRAYDSDKLRDVVNDRAASLVWRLTASDLLDERESAALVPEVWEWPR